jgi:hypothetical protein
MPRRNNPEYELHKAVVEWLGWVKPDCVFFHPYNGAYMSKATAGKGKALGVLPGVADLVFVLPGGKVRFIELKAPKGVLSDNQKAFRDNVRDLGCRYAVARSIEDVSGRLEAWGVTFGQARGRAA